MTEAVRGRRVVLGVTGGIAAYKAVEVCRRLVDQGAHVVPVMTDAATRFLGPATLSALASEKVHTSLWDDDDPIPHTRLGQAADVVVIVPATARFLGAYAAGIADDLVTSTVLATRAPVVVCPAMHTEMWEHPAVRHNMAVLRERGVHVVEPATGHLAGGDEGPGRLADPAAVVAAVEAALHPQDLAGRKVLVTAGGTREPLDAVRFLGNRSSGKQGHALAAEAAARGARVTLVTASDRPPPPGVDVVAVTTAAEMEQTVIDRGHSADVVLMAAAVADFRPVSPRAGKLEKTRGVPEVVLEPTPDILAGLGRAKAPGQVLVGFAAETSDVVARATAKLTTKGLDVVVANDVSASDAGFEQDDNRAVIIEADGTTTEVPLMDKRTLASLVLDVVVRHLTSSTSSTSTTRSAP
ncbi:MAG TPA: bifunctional phosphopantothenoylcysteine decarboxylase/phosphopantothenate--cysteine ligase CoaBC [Acidimicrobiales bacterium]|nr:bifunctional phosphopantothenoylcysteine decarboxylase/phosphopantothenate--cysteine ligase CoaBC [Acidimicrobiales bacterium]